MQPYPKTINTDIVSVATTLRQISRLREEDILDRDTINSTFMRGRKVAKVPTASNDVAATDRIGDFNYDASYLYLLIDNAGTPEWRRFTAGSW